MGNVSKYFAGGLGQKEIIDFLSTYNMATQAIAIDSTAQDIQSTGLAPVVIDGVLIPALPADAALDVSADAVGDAAGTIIADGSEQYFAVLAKADGTLSVWVAGSAATTGSAVCQIPDFDPATFVCVGLMLVDASGAAFTIGTTALTSRVSFYQMIGPVFPYPSNIDNG